MKKRNKIFSFIMAMVMIMATVMPTASAFAEELQSKSQEITEESSEGGITAEEASVMPKEDLSNSSKARLASPRLTKPSYPQQGSIGLNAKATWMDTSGGSGSSWDQFKGRYIAEVELEVDGIPKYQGVDTVIIADTSGSMANGQRMPETKKAAAAFTKAMLKPHINKDPSDSRVALISFNTGAATKNNFTTVAGEQQVLDQIELLAPEGFTNYQAAFDKAHETISRRADKSRPVAVVFLTDGKPELQGTGDTPPSVYMPSVNKVKALAEVYSLSLEMNAGGAGILTPIATSPAHFRAAAHATELTGIFNTIASNMKIAGSNGVVTHKISKYFNLVESPSPITGITPTRGTASSGDKRTITWNIGDILSAQETGKDTKLKFYIELKPEFIASRDNFEISEVFDLNGPNEKNSSTMSYLDYQDKPQTDDFPVVILPHPYGHIRVESYLVDNNGDAISASGSKLSDNKPDTIEKYGVLLGRYFIKDKDGNVVLEYGPYTFKPDQDINSSGKKYEIHTNFDKEQTINVSSTNRNPAIYVGYKEAPKFDYTVNHKSESGIQLDTETGKEYVRETVKGTQKTIPGYKFKEGNPDSIVISNDISKNIINMIYSVDKSQLFDYEITHVNEAGDEIAPKDTGKLPVESDVTAVEKTIAGYKYKSANPGKTIKITSAGPNKIVVTYEVDRDQLFDYEIRYYMDKTTSPALGVEDFLTDYNKATGKIVGKGYLGQDIPVTIPTGAQLANGYGPVSTNPTEVLTNGNFKTTVDKNKNIVTVNYGIDKDVKLDYKINYYILADKKVEITNLDSLLTKNSANSEAYVAKELTGKGHLGEKIAIQQPDISGLSGYSMYKIQSGLPTEMTLKAGVNEVDIYYVRDKNATADYSISYVDENGDSIKDLNGEIQVKDITGTGRIGSRKVVPQPKLEGYEVEPGQETMMTIEGTADDHKIIKYKKQKYNYEINYLEYGSNKPIKVLGAEVPKESGKELYGTKVNASLPSIGTEYELLPADQDPVGRTYDMVVGANETKNVMNIYFRPTKADIVVSFYLKDTTTKIHKDVTFSNKNATDKIKIEEDFSNKEIDSFAKAGWGGGAIIPAYYKLQDGSKNITITHSGMNIALYYRR